MRAPFSPYHCQNMLFSAFLMRTVPGCVRIYLLAVLFCVSLVTNDAEYHFICLFALDGSFWWHLAPLSIFQSGCCRVSLSLLATSPLANRWFAKKTQALSFFLLLQIYFASCAFGTEHIRTSGGYFHLANIFHGLQKLDLADTLYTKVSWRTRRLSLDAQALCLTTVSAHSRETWGPERWSDLPKVAWYTI